MTEWQRLHPLSLVSHIGRIAWAIVGVLAFDFLAFPGAPRWLEPVFAIAALGVAVLRYVRMEYRVTDEVVELRQGIFLRTLRTTRRDRVQNVTIGANVLARMVQVAEVQISAGDNEEIRLAYLGLPAAQTMRDTLLATVRGAAAPVRAQEPVAGAGTPGPGGPGPDGWVMPAPAVPSAPPPVRQLASLDMGEVLLFAITGNGALALLLAAAAAVGMLTGGLGAAIPLAAAAAGFLSRADLFDFSAAVDDRRLHVQRGLLRREEGSAPLSRIQMVEVSRPPLRRALQYETVSVRTADVSGSEARTMDIRLVAPLGPLDGWRPLAHALLGDAHLPEESAVRRVSPVTKRITRLRGSVAVGAVASIPTIVLGVLVSWTAGLIAGSAILVVGLAAVWAYAAQRWARIGYATTDDALLIRSGVIWRRLQLIPLAKVQSTTTIASLLRRRLGVASVLVDVAGKDLVFPPIVVDLPATDARDLSRRLVDTAANVSLPDGV